MNEVIKCGISVFLDQCDYARISANGVGCAYTERCEFQRPLKPEPPYEYYSYPTIKVNDTCEEKKENKE